MGVSMPTQINFGYLRKQALARDDRGQGFSPRITSLSRYFHRLADAIEWGVL